MASVVTWLKDKLAPKREVGLAETASFWDTEAEAALLDRNRTYLTLASAGVAAERARGWKNMIVSEDEELPSWCETCDDEACQRIFRLDAVRTFNSEECRDQLVACLSTVYQETEDYHQGVGFIVAFLLLLLPPTDAVELTILLHRHRLTGYFKSAPRDYVRDARALQKIFEKKLPAVAEKFEENGMVPEMYASKWFIGLCVHVLDFAQLVDFFELVAKHGKLALFSFGLALVRVCESDIMASSADTQKLLAILRLDEKEFMNEFSVEDRADFLERLLLQAAVAVDELDKDEVQDLIKEAEAELAEEQRLRDLRAAEMSDDSIVFSDEDSDEDTSDEV